MAKGCCRGCRPRDCALLVMAARGTAVSSLPPACRQTGACPGSGERYALRPPERSYIWTSRRSRRPEASGHRVEYLGAFCVTSRSSLALGVCRPIRMVFSGIVPSPGFQSRLFILADERTVRRTRPMALLCQGGNPKARKNSNVILTFNKTNSLNGKANGIAESIYMMHYCGSISFFTKEAPSVIE